MSPGCFTKELNSVIKKWNWRIVCLLPFVWIESLKCLQHFVFKWGFRDEVFQTQSNAFRSLVTNYRYDPLFKMWESLLLLDRGKFHHIANNSHPLRAVVTTEQDRMSWTQGIQDAWSNLPSFELKAPFQGKSSAFVVRSSKTFSESVPSFPRYLFKGSTCETKTASVGQRLHQLWVLDEL